MYFVRSSGLFRVACARSVLFRLLPLPLRNELHAMTATRPPISVRIAFGVYKAVISPVLHAFSPSQCLYLPTCSEYAYVALCRFGVLRGSWLAPSPRRPLPSVCQGGT